MSNYFSRIHVELTSLRKGFLSDSFQFSQVNEIVLDEENNVIKIGVETTIQLAQCNTMPCWNRYYHTDQQ